ncbi:MAG: class I SAM-dependent methyltransferase [Cyanobacteria bacterium RUI128]|nr:class I SAM-dependent methyltransferase [Cyanobacteria bacterium RUI128]
MKRLSQYFSINASSYFRRGQYFGEPADEFIDVVDVINSVFKNTHSRKNILIIGVGSSQEPFSYLAVTKTRLRSRHLDKNVDMHVVDMQSRPDTEKLFANSFYDRQTYPKYAGSSFVYDPVNRGVFENCHYRVNDEIFTFVDQTYKNPEKSLWDTRIQDVACNYPDNKFHIISANNVLPYIGNYEIIIDTLEELKRSLKPKGYLITDPYKFPYMRDFKFLKGLSERKEGIYQKLP